MLSTWLDIVTEDAQGYQNTLSYRIKDAALGATTLPTSAKIEAVINAIFGDTKFSSNIVKEFSVRVRQDQSPAAGGTGGSATSTSLRVRNNIDGPNWLFTIPALIKDNVVYDPTNPNSASTSGALWTALRGALVDADIAVSAPSDVYVAEVEADLAQAATVYDGKRSPLRPR